LERTVVVQGGQILQVAAVAPQQDLAQVNQAVDGGDHGGAALVALNPERLGLRIGDVVRT